jgi:outer membrane protein
MVELKIEIKTTISNSLSVGKWGSGGPSVFCILTSRNALILFTYLSFLLMKTQIILRIIAFFTLFYGKTAAQKLSLKQCIETAHANNLQLKQSEIQMQTAEINYNQAKNNKLPNVNGSFNFGINNGRSIDPFTNAYNNEQLSSSNAAINANFVVYNGGRLQNVVKQNGVLWQANKMNWQQEKDNLTLNVILAYLQVLNSEDLLVLAKTQVEVTQKQLARLDILNKNGATQPAIVYDMKGQYASDELTVINAENALESSKLNLAQLMNSPYGKTLKLERVGEEAPPSVLAQYEASATVIYDEALKQFAMVKAAELRQQSATIEVKVAESNFYPTVSLFGQLGTNYSSAAQRLTATGKEDVPTNNFVTLNGAKLPVISSETNFKRDKISYPSQFGNNLNSFIGVNVQIPIFTAFQSRTLVNLAKLQEQNANIATENIKRQLLQAIEQAHLNMTATYNRYRVLNQQVAAFQASFNATEKRFTEGVIHSVDYLLVKNNLDRAKANLVNTRYDYLFRTKILDFYRDKQ